jgi:hypothetical protein
LMCGRIAGRLSMVSWTWSAKRLTSDGPVPR